ncbi:MAG: AI-2E family transporter [Tannerella sp.]|jgi:predicted PurR-regulated permease PerM|nr:AI-2E family transporter [Tannerella sp.]
MAETTKEQYWKYSLILLIALIGVLIFSELWPFVNGLLGAFTIFVLVRKQMVYLTERRGIHKIVAAILILLEVVVIIAVPIYFIALALINKIQTINIDINVLATMIQQFETTIKEKFNYELFNTDTISIITSYLSKGIQYIINQASGFVVTFVVMIFILYFILVDYRKLERYVFELLPFNEGNSNEISREVYSMVQSNAIGIPLLAIIQGIIAYIGYLIFDVPSALFFAILTCFSTIIPLVGTGVIWVPLAVYFAIIGDWFNAIGLAIYSAVILTNVDNVIRLVIQKKLANTHPLITVFGVILGLSVFGFWGVIFGPLLLSLVFLLINIFKREYLK